MNYLRLLPFISSEEEIAQKLQESCLKEMNSKDADKWNSVDVCNWLLIQVGVTEKVANPFMEAKIQGETLISGFKNEDDLESLAPQAQNRALIFKEKEKVSNHF